MAGETIVVEVVANLAKLDQGLKQAEAKVKSSSSRMDRTAQVSPGGRGQFGTAGNQIASLLVGGSAIGFLAKGVADFRRILDEQLRDPAVKFADALRTATTGLTESFANTALGTGLAERIRNSIALSITGPQGAASIGAATAGSADPNIVNGQVFAAIQRARIEEARARLKAGSATEADVRSLEFNAATQGISDLIQSLRIQGADPRLLRELEEVLKSTAKLNRDQISGAGTTKEQKALIDSFDTVFGQFRIAGGQGVVKAQNEAARKTAEHTKRTADNTQKTAAAVDRIARSLVGFA